MLTRRVKWMSKVLRCARRPHRCHFQPLAYRAPTENGSAAVRVVHREGAVAGEMQGLHQVRVCPPGTPRRRPAPILRATTAAVLHQCAHAAPGFHSPNFTKGIPTTRGGAPPGCAKPEARRAPPFSGGALRAAAESGPHGGTGGSRGPCGPSTSKLLRTGAVT